MTTTVQDLEKGAETALSTLIAVQKFTGIGGPITAAIAEQLDKLLLAAIAGAQGKLDPAVVQAHIDALPTPFAADDAQIDAEIAAEFPKS